MGGSIVYSNSSFERSRSRPAESSGPLSLVPPCSRRNAKEVERSVADEIDFLGADLIFCRTENVYITMIDREPLSTNRPRGRGANPAFRQDELAKLKRRELDRLALAQNDARYLARREFLRAVYGEHPYARYDTTPDVVGRVRTQDLARCIAPTSCRTTRS